MIVFPAALAPPPPFPLVVAQAAAPEFVAPGVMRADYRLTTNLGPLVVHVVAVDTQDETVRLGVVVARDHLISGGETVSSMAIRTGAIAGVNGDYFDIGQTNQPLNVVVSDGMLLRTPSKRAALAVGDNGVVGFGNFTFSGTIADNGAALPLTGVNEWPPDGGASFLTPAYGSLAAAPQTEVAQLQPLDTTAGDPGSYRVAAIGPPQAGPVRGTLLGFGPAAVRAGTLPAVDDVVDVEFSTQPSFRDLSLAIGGGPLLIRNGAPVDDPNAPAPDETGVAFPVAGAAVTADGTLLLFAVDGREPTISVGVTRPQFGALMRAFGATDGMAFDSGGSATLVARVLGDDLPTVLNTPSDGRERPVADGLFVYSDAPRGNDPQLVVRPSSFAALPGATVTLAGAVVDDAGHYLRYADVPPLVADPSPGEHTVTVQERGGLSAELSYRTVDRVATLQLVPDRPNPQPFANFALHVQAFDAGGTPVALGSQVVWRAGGAGISGNGTSAIYRAGEINGTVTVSAGGATLTTVVLVGSHTSPLPPLGAGGDLVLPYDFTGAANVATTKLSLELPGDPSAFRVDVLGDGNGAVLRAAFVNRFGELQRVTLAPAVSWRGWRPVTVALPGSLNPPVRLTAIYVLPVLDGPRIRAAGTLRFRDASVVVRGSG